MEVIGILRSFKEGEIMKLIKPINTELMNVVAYNNESCAHLDNGNCGCNKPFDWSKMLPIICRPGSGTLNISACYTPVLP